MPVLFDESFDYLALLEVNAAQARRTGVTGLQELLRQKRKEWTSQAINPLYQQQARANLERAKQLDALLKEPAAAAAWLQFAEQRQLDERRRKQAEFLPLLQFAAAGTQTITSAQWELLVKAGAIRGLAEAAVDELLQQQKMTIVAANVTAAGPVVPYRSHAMEPSLFAQVQSQLAILGKLSFYELLDLPQNTHPARIAAVAQPLHAKWSRVLPKTAEVTAWEKSLQSCLTYLGDDEKKRKYDHALFNARIDRFLEQVDLQLARGEVSRETWTQLITMGVERFGLESAIAEQSVKARAVARGVSPGANISVTVQTAGQILCSRCYRYSPPKSTGCQHCGASLKKSCRNPNCRTVLAADAKVCPNCQLPVARGATWHALWQLAEAMLDAGFARQALDAIAALERITPVPELAGLTKRATRIRTLSAEVREAAGEKRWTAVRERLPELVSLAPRLSQPGIPVLEDVSRFISQARERLQRLVEQPVRERLPGLLEIAQQWLDDPATDHAIQSCLDELEATGETAIVRSSLDQLIQRQPGRAVWTQRLARLSASRSTAAATDNPLARHGVWPPVTTP